MARLLINGEWFDSLDPSSLYEQEFERIIMHNASSIYPGFILVPFKKTVAYEFGAARADLALIDNNYRHWWVVEVELGIHSLLGHVAPQVQVLASAQYGMDEAKYLAQKSPRLDESALINMMKGSQPRVLVIVDRMKENWDGVLQRFDAMVEVIELFRSDKNQYVVRINGQHPSSVSSEFISHCYVDPTLSRAVVVSSPAGLPISHSQSVTIEFDGGISEWTRLDVRNAVWLLPNTKNPLDKHRVYAILRGTDGRLHFEVTS